MRKSWFTIVLVGNVILGGLYSNQTLAQQGSPEFVPDEIIVGFKSKKTADEGFEELKEIGRSVERQPDGVKLRTASSRTLIVERIDKTSVKLKLDLKQPDGTKLRGPSALAPLEEFANDLRANPDVKYAHPNWVLKLQQGAIGPPVYFKEENFTPPVQASAAASGPNDTWFQRGLQWHYLSPPTGMNALKAWDKTNGDKSVVVAVIDTGILFDHPDLKGSDNVLPGYDFISQVSKDGDAEAGRDPDPTDPGDQCEDSGPTWHGSHVAGTIGAGITNNNKGIAGVNWSISVMPVRVLGRCGGTIVDLADAVRWSAGLTVSGVPKNPKKADVINLSLSVGLSCSLQNVGKLTEAIDAARSAGVTVVAAAGNHATDIENYTPAGCPGVISVAASDRRGHLAPYSNFGAVTIMGPGGDINRDDDGDGMPDGVWSLVAPDSSSSEGVAAYQGTSMAAPHVSAAIAMAIVIKPELRGNPDKIAALVTRTAAKLTNGACSKPCGPGQLDAGRMLEPELQTSEQAN